MSKRVYKYELRLQGPFSLRLPRAAVPLSVGFQQDAILCAWFLVNAGDHEDTKEFFVAMTGQDLPDNIGGFDCLGRATAGNGSYEVHVFMRRPITRPDWSLEHNAMPAVAS